MTVIGTTARTTDREICSEPSTSRAWWFLGCLAVLRNPLGAPRTPVVMELTIPPGGSPPEHVHEALDDSFLLLGGELVARCGGETLVAREGTYLSLPRGVPHTFRVTSRVPARLLLVHADDSFLRFVEEIGTPTDDRRLPPPGEGPTDLDAVMRASAAHGAPMVGGSLEEDEARRAAPEAYALAPFGTVHHVSVEVSDLVASERWYVNAFGLVRVDGEIADDGTGHLILLDPGSGSLVTLASGPSPRVEHIAFGCADRETIVGWRDAMAARGVEVGTITDAPYGSGFVVRDPDGIELELFAAAPPA